MTPVRRQLSGSTAAIASTSPPSTPAARFGRRPGQRRRSGVRPLLVLLALAALAVFAGWALLGSSWLSTQKVTVTGEQTLSDHQVVATARVALGTPLVRLNLDAVRQRVAALRAVASVSVHRAWPDTVAISITERQPVAALAAVGGGWDLLDKSGIVFRHQSGLPALPLIQVPPTRDPATLRAAASVMSALPVKLLGRVRQLTAPTMDSITLKLTDGRQVRWGSAEQNSAKIRVLMVLLRRPAHSYDVSVPAQPTTAR